MGTRPPGDHAGQYPRQDPRDTRCGVHRAGLAGVYQTPPSEGGPMAALSPAQASAASLWLVVFLVALLALSLAAVITSPSRTGSPPAEGAGGEPDLAEPGDDPPASPLPRRVAGQSGVAYPAGDPARPPGVIRPPGVSGGPPWGTGAQAARRAVRSRAPPAGLTP